MRSFLVFLIITFGLIYLLGCTPAPAPTPTPEPTPTPTPIATPTPTGVVVIYEDPAGDCLAQADNSPQPCDPQGVDILRVTITRASPLTIEIELAGDGIAELTQYVVIFGLDLDRDPTTGDQQGWPANHGVAPDLEAGLFFQDGMQQSGVVEVAPDGTFTELDASLVAWNIPDNNHIQAVFDEGLLDQLPFSVAGDIFEEVIYDHFVDNGHILFPEGDVVLLE